MKAKADVFIEQLRANAGKPMDVTAWSMFFGFDGASSLHNVHIYFENLQSDQNTLPKCHTSRDLVHF